MYDKVCVQAALMTHLSISSARECEEGAEGKSEALQRPTIVCGFAWEEGGEYLFAEGMFMFSRKRSFCDTPQQSQVCVRVWVCKISSTALFESVPINCLG